MSLGSTLSRNILGRKWILEFLGAAFLFSFYFFLQLNAIEHEAYRGQDFFTHKTWINQAAEERETFLWTYGQNRSNPPLYHYLAGTIKRRNPGGYMPELAQWNLGCSLVGLLAAYFIICHIVDHRMLRLAALCVILFLPVLVIQSTVIAADALATPLFLLFVASMIAVLRGSSRYSFLFAACLASLALLAGVLTKFTFLSQVVAALVLIVCALLRNTISWKRALFAAFVIAIPGASVGRWQMRLYQSQSTYNHGLTSPRTWKDLSNASMNPGNVFIPQASDIKLLEAPQFLETIDGKPILQQSHSFSYPGLLHFAAFSDILNVYQFDPFHLYAGLRLPPAQSLMALAVKTGLGLTVLAFLGLAVHLFLVIRGLFPKWRFDPVLSLVVIAGIGWYLNIALFLPVVAAPYAGCYWHPRLVAPAIICFVLLGFRLIQTLNIARFAAPALLLFALFEGALHARFLWPGQTAVSNFVDWNHQWISAAPEFDVEYLTGQGVEGDSQAPFFWVGDAMGVLVRRQDAAKPTEEFVLSLTLAPGPSNPSPLRQVALELPDGTRHFYSFRDPLPVKLPVKLSNGRNLIMIQVLAPRTQEVIIPGDGRHHAVQVRDIKFELPRPASLTPQASPPLPYISVRNLQGCDGGPGAFWYWMGKSLEIDIEVPDNPYPRALYELRFLASAGPSLKKTVAPLQVVDSSGKKFSTIVDGASEIVVPLRLVAGTNSVRLQADASMLQSPGKGDPRLFGFSISKIRMATVRGYEGQVTVPIIDHGPFAAPPLLTVTNPQGQDGPPGQNWYWIGEPAELLVEKRDKPTVVQGYRLQFRLAAGPGSASPSRLVHFVQPNGDILPIQFDHTTSVDIPIRLVLGQNKFRIYCKNPSKHSVPIPNDPRKLLLQLSGVTLIEPPNRP